MEDTKYTIAAEAGRQNQGHIKVGTYAGGGGDDIRLWSFGLVTFAFDVRLSDSMKRPGSNWIDEHRPLSVPAKDIPGLGLRTSVAVDLWGSA